MLLFDFLSAYEELCVAKALLFLLVIFSIRFFGRLGRLDQLLSGLGRSLSLLDEQFVALLLRLFNHGGRSIRCRRWVCHWGFFLNLKSILFHPKCGDLLWRLHRLTSVLKCSREGVKMFANFIFIGSVTVSIAVAELAIIH